MSDTKESKDGIPTISDSEVSKMMSITSRKRRLSNMPKACMVCEAPTQYSHYGVRSCFACKIFFRRMVLSERKNKCKYNPVCEIFGGIVCQSCRFDKCLLVGMNSRAIQFPNCAKAQEIVDYLTKRKLMLDGKYFTLSKIQPKFDQALYSREIENLLYLEFKLKRLRESSYNPTHESDDIRDRLRRPSELKNADKYEIPQEWPINIDEFFKDLDQRKICSFHEVIDFILNVNPKRHWIAVDFILIIEAAKTLPFFDQLNEDDKVTLLERITVVNVVLLQSFYSAQKNSTTLIMPDGLTPITFTRKFKQMPEKLEIEVFCRCIETLQRIGLNTTEYVLLKTIMYCYSCIDGLSSRAREILNKEREKYALTLLRYMQAQLGTMEGAKKYAEVISLVETFFYFAQRNREMHVIISLINNTKLPSPPIVEVLLK